MREFFLTLLIGIAAGILDVLPMIKMKLDKYSIASAFVFYLILPFVIFNLNLYGIVWWMKGGMIGSGLALPVIILVAREDKKSIVPMVVMSIILGTVISTSGYYLI